MVYPHLATFFLPIFLSDACFLSCIFSEARFPMRELPIDRAVILPLSSPLSISSPFNSLFHTIHQPSLPTLLPHSCSVRAEMKCMWATKLIFTQHLRPYDRRPDHLLRNFHAIRYGRYSSELPSLRMSFRKFQCPIDSGLPVVQALAVCSNFYSLSRLFFAISSPGQLFVERDCGSLSLYLMLAGYEIVFPNSLAYYFSLFVRRWRPLKFLPNATRFLFCVRDIGQASNPC